MANQLDRIALVVEDLPAVAADLESLLGIRFTVRDIETLGIRVGLGEDGIELVEKASAECSVEKFWRGPLAAMVIRVDDIAASTRALIEAGYVLDHELSTPGGIEERHFGNSFHGVPLVLYSSSTGLVEATAGHGAPEIRLAGDASAGLSGAG